MLTTKITKAIGGNTDLNTSQSFVFQGATQESEQVLVLVLISATGEDIFTKIRNLGFSAEQYFFSLELPLTERLPKTVEYLFEQTAEIEEKNLLVAVLKDEALYLLSRGSDQVLLLRDQKTINLIHSGDTQLISGFLQPNDKVLFITPRFARLDEPDPVWDDYFIQRLLLSDQEVVEEEIENYLQQLGTPEPIAVIALSTQPISEPQLSPQPKVDDYQEPFPLSPQRPQYQNPNYQTNNNRRLSIPSFRLPTLPPRIKRSLYQLIFPLTFKKIGIVSLIIMTVLISASVFIFQYQQKTQQQNQLTAALTKTRTNLQLADQSKDSNREEAKQYLQVAKSSLQQAENIAKENPEVQTLATQLSQTESIIYKSTQLNNWQTFLTLDLIRPGLTTKKMSFSVGKILLLDEVQKSLVQIDIATKNNQLIAGQTQLGDAQFASLNGDYAFVYSTDKGLLRVETPNRQITTISTPDNEWGEIKDVIGFSSNVYLLDGRNNQIWKYVPARDSYSDKQIYLTDNQSLDFSDAKQLFIDYSVWVIKDTPEIIRFTAGKRDFYSIGGLDTPLTQVEAIFVPEEEDIVLILDQANKRIVTTKKNGEYLSQYTADIFATATDLIFDEESKTLYVLEGGKIHQTNL